MAGIEKLGAKTRGEIARQIKKLMDIHGGELNAAYIKHQDEKFSISLKANIERAGDDNKVVTGISFRPEPDMKDEETGVVCEDQMELFDGQEKEE